jgi:DNA mismatch endonuclease Vsr
MRGRTSHLSQPPLCGTANCYTRTRMPKDLRSRQQKPDFTDVPEARRRNLAAVKSRDTMPEVAIRSLLHRMGYRFRLQRRDLPGRPDIVFPGRRKVIDIRGCFWHRHPDPACKNAVLPRTRAGWWAEKLARNVERDRENEAALQRMDWSVLVLWECEVRAGAASLRQRVLDFLGPPSPRAEADVLTPQGCKLRRANRSRREG